MAHRELFASVLLVALFTGCTAPSVELEKNLEAAVAEEDFAVASQILGDEDWNAEVNPELDQKARYLVRDAWQLETLLEAHAKRPDFACFENYSYISQLFSDWEYQSFGNRASEYVNAYGTNCGEAIFQAYEDMLNDSDFEFSEEEKLLLEDFAWVDETRAQVIIDQISSSEIERETAKLATLKSEIDDVLQNFNTVYDEFDDRTTYFHKTRIAGNGVELQIGIGPKACGATAYFKVIYSASYWLFMDSLEMKQGARSVFTGSWDILSSSYNGEVLFNSGNVRETWSTGLGDNNIASFASLSESEPLALRLRGETSNIDLTLGTSAVTAIKQSMDLYQKLETFQPLATEAGFETEKDSCV